MNTEGFSGDLPITEMEEVEFLAGFVQNQFGGSNTLAITAKRCIIVLGKIWLRLLKSSKEETGMLQRQVNILNASLTDISLRLERR